MREDFSCKSKELRGMPDVSNVTEEFFVRGLVV